MQKTLMFYDLRVKLFNKWDALVPEMSRTTRKPQKMLWDMSGNLLSEMEPSLGATQTKKQFILDGPRVKLFNRRDAFEQGNSNIPRKLE